MKKFYAIEPTFYGILKKHKCLLAELTSVCDIQKNKIFITITLQQIIDSCESYFQDCIIRKDNVLYYEHQIKAQVYSIEICNGYVQMEDVNNPFYELLKRKYRFFLIEDIE